jgi:predicted amidophosphoribosyltransferase
MHSFRVALAKELVSLMQKSCKALFNLNRELLPLPYLSLDEQPANLSARAINLHQPQILINTNVLLIHDSFTTGQSSSLAAHRLVEHGALSVRLLCVATPSTD